MALRRISHRLGSTSPSLIRYCSTTAPGVSPEKAADVEEEETKDGEEETNETEQIQLKSYRTNSVLPNCAFLFPARDKPDQKRLFLKSLRRARFSTVAVLLTSEAKEDSRKCQWCEKEVQHEIKFFCESCQKVLPLNENVDYFSLFSMECHFDIDIPQLDDSYRQYQMLLHPDKHAAKDEKEKTLANTHSTRINKAYKKLKNPLDRAKYLLKISGFSFEKEQTISDPKLLTEMLELQEAVSETNDSEELTKVLTQVDIRHQELLKCLSEAFAARDLKSASEQVIELSYLERVREQIKTKI